MKTKSLLYFILGMILLVIPLTVWPQTSAIPWSAFSGGFGSATSTSAVVHASAGEVVGTAAGDNTRLTSGFLTIKLHKGVVAAIDGPDGLPASYALHQNYPNPFNPVANIKYDLPFGSYVSLAVYDLLGRQVAELINREMEPGYHNVVWNARDNRGRILPTGMYIARLVTPEYSQSIKMVLLR